MHRTFDELVTEADAAPMSGWDFSWLEGRATEERPSWGYSGLLHERIGTVDAARVQQLRRGRDVGRPSLGGDEQAGEGRRGGEHLPAPGLEVERGVDRADPLVQQT